MEMKYSLFYLLLIFVFPLQYSLFHAADLTGFISIDCGSTKTTSFRGLQYSTDEGYIDSGENHDISGNYEADNMKVTDQMLNLRSFPVGKRNCYNLSVAGAGEVAAAGRKGKKYVIRAHFLYGNYDGKNVVPQFDLYLGVENWATIKTDHPGNYKWWDIIHVPTSNYVYVCLVNTGNGIPYISALDLRPMNPKAYTSDPQLSLQSLQRSYFAPGSSNQIIRYPDDIYDRWWSPYPTPTNWKELKTTTVIDNSNDRTLPPPIILQSAVTPGDNNSSNIVFKDNNNILLNFNGEDTNKRLYFSFIFSDVEQHDQVRTFDIYLNGFSLGPGGTVNIKYTGEQSITVDAGTVRKDFNFSLEKSDGSAYPPIISGLEKFAVVQYLQAQTDENDVFALVNIKAAYGLNKSNWQGDPCLPRDLLWEGLDCVTFDDQTTPPKIKYLDLSSSGVSGIITPYLSQLMSLEFLDLSHNNLSGQIPDFLAELPSLKFLNLSGNNLSGPIPQKLTDKANNGQLRLAVTDQKKKNGLSWKSLIKILAMCLVALLLSLAIALFIIYRKRIIINQGGQLFSIQRQKDVDTGDISGKFTMAEIKRMTKNFKNSIGKGGFGEVFHGKMTNGTEVAVKLLSSKGHNQFDAEVKLLKRARHENLTPILGYCNEGQDMAIVYEYMPNGSLNKFLSTDSEIVLTWRQRLHIAVGATRGLLYLHECDLIHRDVKPENILLDKKLEAKLGDYGLVRETVVDKTHDSTAVQGTYGYVDPEYGVYDQLREKSDVFSMGVVLLRLITGQPLAVKVGEVIKHITHWVKDVDVKDNKQMRGIVDPKLEGKFDMESLQKVFTLARNCAASKSDSRPNMSEVVKELEECLKLARGQLIE